MIFLHDVVGGKYPVHNSVACKANRRRSSVTSREQVLLIISDGFLRSYMPISSAQHLVSTTHITFICVYVAN